MASCVIADVNGVLSVTATAVGECTGFIVLSVEDYNNFAEGAWWNGLTLDDGAAISGAILGVWAVGWAIAQIARLLKLDDERKDDA